ncbi:MAG: GNAT family N-acetyltransferase [Oscillospiraceae bacterium]|jgi:aminoglycoside 6'-N-acetyltransferase I|nr:GNAT family N-acetyltransferase [Oscillospiraceae bacterium]
MDEQNYRFQRLGENEREAVRELFVSVFTASPWNDDWSDERQLRMYLQDLTGQSNSLTFGLYEGEELIGLSMGHIRHWYTGTEYFIDELCVRTSRQGKGAGTFFIHQIESACRELGMRHLFLLTEQTVPAFEFYKRQGFYQLKTNVAFAKEL